MAPPPEHLLRGPARLTATLDLPAVIRATGLLPPGARVLVAVSGGPDSLALLHALCQLRCAADLLSTEAARFVVARFTARGQGAAPRPTRAEARYYEPDLGLHLVVAHLDHQLRPDSAADAARVAEIARSWDLPCVTRAVDVRALAAAEGRTLEEAGREARYRFLIEAAAEHGCSHVALGHTACDQAETVLLHLLRGTGLSGLAGMPVERPLGAGPGSARLVRPLLAVRRETILAYCRAQGLDPVIDPTNTSPAFTRNRIRGELLPHLAAEYNPGIVEGLIRLAGTVREEVELRDLLAEELLAAATLPEGPVAGARLDPRRLRERPNALAVAALRLAFARCAGPGAQLDAAATDRLMCLLVRESGAEASLLNGWSAYKSGTCLLIASPHSWQGRSLEAGPLAVPGSLALPAAGRSIAASLGVPPVELPAPPDAASLDADAMRGELRVRAARPGDRLRPLGMRGSKKVSSILSDAGVPRPDRGFVPLVVDEEKILWVAGHVIHHDARVTPGTRRVLRLRLVPLAS